MHSLFCKLHFSTATIKQVIGETSETSESIHIALHRLFPNILKVHYQLPIHLVGQSFPNPCRSSIEYSNHYIRFAQSCKSSLDLTLTVSNGSQLVDLVVLQVRYIHIYSSQYLYAQAQVTVLLLSRTRRVSPSQYCIYI